MTTEEKLKQFEEVCMEDARAHFQKILSDYETGLRGSFEEHQKDAKRRQDMRVSIETERIEREARRTLSLEQINLRRKLSAKQEELVDQLFSEVEEKLLAYRKTDVYCALLRKQIREITAEAGKRPCEIYIDPGDEALLANLPAGVLLSDEPILGGTMAVIPSMNIFIDNTFRTRLEKERAGFRFATGGNDEQQ